jgi:hypothetical protein
VQLVTVNVDNAAGDAVKFVNANQVPATHLHQQGGLDSPLAAGYGVLLLPQTFLVGKDGKVLNRNARVATLEDELKKLVQ